MCLQMPRESKVCGRVRFYTEIVAVARIFYRSAPRRQSAPPPKFHVPFSPEARRSTCSPLSPVPKRLQNACPNLVIFLFQKRRSKPRQTWGIILYHVLARVLIGSSKKILAKFSDTCSVTSDWLCIGCFKLVGRGKAGKSNIQDLFCSSL